MKRIGFYAATNRSGNLLHIETDGAVVNIQVGLHDADGRQVTSVRISPDGQNRGGDGEGRIWVQDGSRIIRLHEGETALPGTGETTLTLTVTTPDGTSLQDIAAALDHALNDPRHYPEDVDTSDWTVGAVSSR